MKILFVIPAMKCGGAERVATTFAKCLSEHEVKFVNLGSADGELTNWIKPYFPLTSLNCNRSISAYFPLKKLIRREKPDFIFATHIHVALILLLINRRLKSKVVVRIPTMPSNKLYKGLRIRIMGWLERKLMRKAHLIIAQTDAMKKEICNMFDVDSKKVVTIHNPIDTELIDKQTCNISNPFDENTTNYLSVGNISPAKGYDTLLSAFKIIMEKDEKAQLYILGRTDGEYAQQIMAMSDGNPNIHFEGFCNNPYLYMKYCSALVLPSRMEGLPNVVLEAMYLDKPVAATTCVPIIDDLIKDDINGYKVEPDDAISLAQAMQNAAKLTNVHNERHDSSEKIKQIFNRK
jgi:glycosyltransferase involved in cell wall biosynthesis